MQRQRFSCVGYVIEAYRSAEVELLDLALLPEANRSDAEASYPDLIRIATTPALAKKYGVTSLDDLGLHGTGPWKIPLPGYLFHSTARYPTAETRPSPFAPVSIDHAKYP